jgi:hypothetical protein
VEVYVNNEHTLFPMTVGSLLLRATILDPNLRQSPVRSVIVIGFAVTLGALVVGTVAVHNSVTTVRDLLTGKK